MQLGITCAPSQWRQWEAQGYLSSLSLSCPRNYMFQMGRRQDGRASVSLGPRVSEESRALRWPQICSYGDKCVCVCVNYGDCCVNLLHGIMCSLFWLMSRRKKTWKEDGICHMEMFLHSLLCPGLILGIHSKLLSQISVCSSAGLCWFPVTASDSLTTRSKTSF